MYFGDKQSSLCVIRTVNNIAINWSGASAVHVLLYKTEQSPAHTR